MNARGNTQTNKDAAAGIRRGEFEVKAGRRYRFRIDASDESGREGPRGLIGKLQFLDDLGRKMTVAAEGSVHTDRHGAVVYLPTRATGAGSALISENLVLAPAGANRVLVQIRNWKCSPDVVIHSSLEMVEEREPALAQYEFPAQGRMPHALALTLQATVQRARAAILAVEFVDSVGAVIPGPYDGCIDSPRFGPFRYLRATAHGASMRVPLHAPANADRVRVVVYPWQVAMEDLRVVGKPRLDLDIPEGLDAKEWSLLPTREWGMAHSLGEQRDGLMYIAVDCIGIERRPGDEPVVMVDFLDDDGRSIANPDGAAESATITIGSPLKLARRGGFLRCPVGASAICLMLAPNENYSLLVRNSIEVLRVPVDRLPDYALAQLGSARSLESRHAVSSLWSVRVELDGFAVDADSRPLDMGLTLLDAAGKPINPKDVLLEAAHATATIRGSALAVAPHAMASGTHGLIRFATSVRILPPRGAVTLVTSVLNPRAQGTAVAANVRAYDAIASDRLAPESIPEILAMDERFPDKICQLAESYLQLHGQDSRVMSHLIAVYRRLGELGKMEVVARRALATNGTGLVKLHAKARHGLALLQELDPNWLPTAGLGGAVSNRRGTDAQLRVAHLFKTTVPIENTGGAIRCLNIVNFQRKLGMQPFVVTPLGYPDAGGTGQPWEQSVVDGVPYFRLNGVGKQALRGVTSTTQLEFTVMLTVRLLGEQGVDIVQASSGYRGYEQALVGLAVSRTLAVPFVYEVRSYHEHTWRGMTDWLLDAEHTKRRMVQENRCMREADAVVTICETMKQGLIERGIPSEKIFVVPNSVDLEKFHEADPSPELRARLGLGGALVAGYISNVSDREGHHVLLRAVAQVRKAGVAMKCLIVGTGPALAGLRTMAEQMGIAEDVVFTGEVPHEQIAAYYALIDLFVIPRIADFASDFVTPMKPFEAMAMRRPLIVSDRPALLEIVGTDGQRGIVFRAGDHFDLADRLIELASSPEKREALVEEGRRWIETERSWHKTIRIYDQVYAYAKRAASARSTAELVDR